jgi:aminopeptidase N
MAVGTQADNARFATLSERLSQAGSEEDRWLYASALSRTRDRAQAQALLARTIDGSLPSNIAAALPGLLAEHSPFGELAYAFTLQHWAALAKLAGTGPFGGSLWLLPNAAASFSDAPRAARLIEDQRRTAGEAGAAAAATVAAHIEVRAALKAREQASLGALAQR